MFQEMIPSAWVDPKSGKKLDLTEEDLPKWAVFQSDFADHRLFLSPTQSQYNRNTEKDERVPGTGVRLKATGGSLVVKNKKLLQLLMASSAYKRGIVRIDFSDPTGFWRDVGMVEVKTIQVAVFDQIAGTIQYSDLQTRLNKVKVEKDEAGNPIPVSALHNLADAQV